MSCNLTVPVLVRHLRETFMPLDINKYRHFLDDIPISEERKAEFLQDVWSILESFVDSAFGQHPVQLCRTNEEKTDLQALGESLESKMTNTSGVRKYTQGSHLESQKKS